MLDFLPGGSLVATLGILAAALAAAWGIVASLKRSGRAEERADRAEADSAARGRADEAAAEAPRRKDEALRRLRKGGGL